MKVKENMMQVQISIENIECPPSTEYYTQNSNKSFIHQQTNTHIITLQLLCTTFALGTCDRDRFGEALEVNSAWR